MTWAKKCSDFHARMFNYNKDTVKTEQPVFNLETFHPLGTWIWKGRLTSGTRHHYCLCCRYWGGWLRLYLRRRGRWLWLWPLATLLLRVERKIFLFVFSRNFVFTFRKSLTSFYENKEKLFCEKVKNCIFFTKLYSTLTFRSLAKYFFSIICLSVLQFWSAM